MRTMNMLTRLIRLRDAPAYLGMDKNRFNNEVRPQLVEIPIGKQGIAFDRLDLDAWVDHYKHCNGRPVSKNSRRQKWDESAYQGLKKLEACGTSTSKSMDVGFAKALEQVLSKKQENI
jgi:predicted DNA-binding transcriptional regulator AlpA